MSHINQIRMLAIAQAKGKKESVNGQEKLEYAQGCRVTPLRALTNGLHANLHIHSVCWVQRLYRSGGPHNSLHGSLGPQEFCQFVEMKP